MTRTCSDCGCSISATSRTGRCRKHALAATLSNPAVEERRRASLKAIGNDPQRRRENSERVKAYCRQPEVKAKRSIVSRRIMHLTIGSEKARRAAGSPESIRKRAATHSQRKMAWCPPERITEYRDLIRRKGMNSVDARRIILASLTPFERQMLAVRNGARVIEVQPPSTFGRPSYRFAERLGKAVAGIMP